MKIYSNEYFSIFSKNDKVYIDVLKVGYKLVNFNSILSNFPKIELNNFLNLKKAFESKPDNPIEIGILKPPVEIYISADNMTSSVKLNLTSEEINKDKKNIITEIIDTLKANEITYGIKINDIKNSLQPNKKIIVAEGTLPIDGNDAKVKYIDLPDRKPKIDEDNKADFYEIDLFKQVKKGDWIGEKIPPTKGKPGVNIKGEKLPPKPGKDKLLRYDKKSVNAITENNKIVLKAKIDGIVEFKTGKICVLDHLIIPGDVGYDTGNIDFDGYITIKGTVHDGFNVTADKDISILGTMGIGAVNKIISKNGEIYIKGGVSGKDVALIKAKKNVYVKYANSCSITCDKDVHIGFYSIDSTITANNVIVHSKKGRIIGGTINAKAKLSTPTIGNISERKTDINVKGFDRKKIKKEFDELLVKYKKHLNELDKNKRSMKVYENSLTNPEELLDSNDYKYYMNSNEKLLEEISELEERRNILMNYLKSKGDGEVSIMRKAYPKTFIQIKNMQKIVKYATSGTFYAKDNKLHLD